MKKRKYAEGGNIASAMQNVSQALNAMRGDAAPAAQVGPEAAAMQQKLASIGMQMPKFNPAQAGELRAKIANMSARQGLPPMPGKMGIPSEEIAMRAARSAPSEMPPQSAGMQQKMAGMRGAIGSGMAGGRGVTQRIPGAPSGQQTFAKGGSVRGGGCEQRGKTKGKFR